MITVRSIALSGALLTLTSTEAFAHHALGGRLPFDFTTGLLSGLAHPVINFEHFAFVVALGVLTAVAQGSRLLPVLFVAGTVAGCLAVVQGFAVPSLPWYVAVSVALLGIALALGHRRLGQFEAALFAVAGFLHGAAYAQSIIGTGINSLTGYLLGFAIIQVVVALSAMVAAYWLWCGDKLYANARVVGGMVAGVGLTVMVQAGLAQMFPV